MRYWVELDGLELVVDVGGRWGTEVTVGDGAAAKAVPVEVSDAGARLTVRVGPRVYDVVLDGTGPERRVTVGGRRGVARVESARQRAEALLRSAVGGAGDGTLVSPMPGKVVKVLASVGAPVERGEPLVVVEAMKMENELVAARAGTVAEVLVRAGDAVEGGARLVVVA